MIVRIAFKDPDGVYYALKEATTTEEAQEQLQEKLEKWLLWGEVVQVDFDLEQGTATVVRQD